MFKVVPWRARAAFESKRLSERFCTSVTRGTCRRDLSGFTSFCSPIEWLDEAIDGEEGREVKGLASTGRCGFSGPKVDVCASNPDRYHFFEAWRQI